MRRGPQLFADPVHYGALAGTLYRFAKGEGLPMHIHDGSSAHVTFVIRGKIVARGDGWETTHTAGHFVDFPIDERHEIEAIEDGTRILNLLKGAS